jgi:SRSO17 transposase
VTPAELAAVRGRLDDFAGEIFAPFARREQRLNGGLYLRGLMLDGRRKSMQPMAERLGVDHQRLQQFITSSTWDYVAVRRRLAARSLQVVAPVWTLTLFGSGSRFVERHAQLSHLARLSAA